MSYDYALLQYYGDGIREGTVVFINISYFSLFGEDEVINFDFQSKNKRYYKILPNNLIKDYDLKTDIYVNYLPCLAAEDWGVLFEKPVNKTDLLWDRVTTDEQLEQTAYKRYLDHVAANVDENGNRIINETEIQALRSIIEFCQNKGAIPILITPPYTDAYKNAIIENDETFYDDFLNLIESVEDEYGVDYYDYSSDSRFCSNYALFMDQDHMNREGARLYTNTLFEEIVKVYLIDSKGWWIFRCGGATCPGKHEPPINLYFYNYVQLDFFRPCTSRVGRERLEEMILKI